MIQPPGLRRAAFALYAIALFVATHWPRLVIDSPVIGTDKIIHATAFLIWTLLLAGASGPGKRIPIGRLALICTVYACIDEGLQAIPALGRTCSWADLGADLLGVAIGLGAIAIRRGRRAEPAVLRGEG